MEEGIIPSRIEGETAKAYRGFVDYCEMGAARSIRGLLARYRMRTVGEEWAGAPTQRRPTLERWSTTHNWQSRVAEYERRAAEARTQARIQKQIELEDGVLDDAVDMLDLVMQRWAQYREVPKAVSTYEVRQIIHARRDLDDLARRSAGLPDRVTESTLKGAGEGGAIPVITEIVFRGPDGSANTLDDE